MREEIIRKFGEGQLDLQCVDECCSSCDIKEERDLNAKQAISLLIEAVLDLGQMQAYKEGVKEEVLIGWLRGSKKHAFSLPVIKKSWSKHKHIPLVRRILDLKVLMGGGQGF